MLCSDEQWTLGRLIDALAKRPVDQEVRFDFGYLAPAGLDSYRGYYEDLALSFKDTGRHGEHTSPTVAALLGDLRGAVGKSFTGYKGGEFTMGRDTAMWVANYGESGGTAVVGVDERCEYLTIITTKWID